MTIGVVQMRNVSAYRNKFSNGERMKPTTRPSGFDPLGGGGSGSLGGGAVYVGIGSEVGIGAYRVKH